MRRGIAVILAGLPAVAGTPALADPIKNPIAVFAGLDKVTGGITSFEVPVDQTHQFGTLTVRPRVCYSRPVTEEPKTTSFVEIDETNKAGKSGRVFSGWMFAESPGLNALEHPVYDVWLTGCKDPNAPKPVQEAPPAQDGSDKKAIPQDND
ncbi:MAG: DUF2155 domain-containing protein [Hyphomicrobiales bacterium]